MNTSRLVIGVAVLCALSSCTLRDYGSGVVGCDPDKDSCPTGYACLDPKDLKFNTCIKIGCGDGQRDLNSGEQCDDGDDNDLDACVACVVKQWQEEPVLGFGPGKGVLGETPIGRPTIVTHDTDGNVFISSIGTNTITRLDTAGTLTTFAGNGSLVSAETGAAVPPNEVTTLFSSSIAVDGLGNVFFADLQNAVVRRIDAVTGDTVTVAGSGVQGTGADNVPGTQSSLDIVVGLALDGDGNLFMAEKQSGGTGVNRIRRLNRRTNIITTVIAGRSDGGPASSTQLDGLPNDIAFAADGRLFVFTNSFDRFSTERSPSTGPTFTVDTTVSYAVTILTLNNEGAVVDKEYVVVDLRIDRRTSTEEVLVGVDADDNGVDDVELVASSRELLTKVSDCEAPNPVQERFAVSDDGRHIFHPAGRRVLQLQLPTATEPAACTVIGSVPGGDDDGDEEPVSTAGFALVPTDVSFQDGTLLVADPGNGVVWRLRDDQSNALAELSIGKPNDVPAGLEPFEALVSDLVLEFAKQTDGHLGAGITTACAQRDDDGVLVDDGVIGFEDFEFFAPFPDLHRVVLSDCNSAIAVIAGNGVAGFAGDGGPAVDAKLAGPTGVVRGLDGDIYVADRDNNRIRRILVEDDDDPATNDVQRAKITTFIGPRDPNDPTVDKHAIGEAATLVLDRPGGLALDDTGALLISDASHRIQRVVMVANEGESVGDVTTVFGTGTPGFNGDNEPANETQLDEPAAIVFLPFFLLEGQVPFVPPGGVLIVAERGGHRIRATIMPPLGEPSVYTLAGTGEAGLMAPPPASCIRAA
jgi:hypothetical protein